jgi:hypothetical protein
MSESNGRTADASVEHEAITHPGFTQSRSRCGDLARPTFRIEGKAGELRSNERLRL